MMRTLSVLMWAALQVLPLAAWANPGDLDPSFGTGGQVITPISSGYDAANALVVQPDGKLVAAGHAYNAGNTVFALVRYNPDGTLDGTFGSGGKVTTVIGTASRGTALVLQPDGKLVAAGYTYNGNSTAFALVRYNTNGGLDTSFGSGGKVTTAIGSLDDEPFALILQSNGKLVAAGYSDNGSTITFALVRYNANGSLDTTFGTGGKVTTSIGGVDDEAFALVLQPDGKLVAAGYAASATTYAFALVRYNSSGSLDTSFGTGGKVTTAIGTLDDEAIALVLQPDGKLVAAGYSDNGASITVELVRYSASGSLDTGFGTGGKVSTPIGGVDDEAFALALQPDGKLVAAGYANDGSSQDFGLVRYTAQGALDGSFGTAGHVTTPIMSSYSSVNGLVLQPNGNLVAAGYSFNGTNTSFTLTRYLGQVCGDGIVQAPEQCDAGAANGTLASCCTTTCQLQASGTSCNDGNACTYNDQCTGGGACIGTGITCTSDQCATRSCNGTSSCTVTPLPCSTTTTSTTTTSTTTTQPPTTTSSTTSTSSTSTTSTTSTTLVATSTTSTTTTQPPSTTTTTTITTSSTSTSLVATTTSSTTTTQPSNSTTTTSSTSTSVVATSTTSTTTTQPPSTTTTTSSTSTSVVTTSTTSTTTTQPPSTTSTSTTVTTTTQPAPTTTTSTTTTTTTDAASTTSTTMPCPDRGFAGVDCLLRSALQPTDCTADTVSHALQRRITQAASLIEHGSGTSNVKKARTLARKASKAVRQAVTLATMATAKGSLSRSCGDALGSILQDARSRTDQLAAGL
ncbi:MAG: hypothetical protein E6J79_03985 [Deltaproteobacteria bacterium]|nr:MAG: hypothetical protein E6J79_03985 [Deltaproteobacteria bacterium]